MRRSAALSITLIVLMLAGCRTADPVVTPQPEPTSTPLFASDEEALAAAEEAYAAYLAVVDVISGEGGLDPDRLASVANSSVVDHEKIGFAETLAHGERSVGARAFDSLTMQSALLDPGQELIVTYLCQDYSDVDVVDSSGQSVVSASRQLRYPLVVEFEPAEGQETLIVSAIDDWTGKDFCAL